MPSIRGVLFTASNEEYEAVVASYPNMGNFQSDPYLLPNKDLDILRIFPRM